MLKTLIQEQIKYLASANSYEYAALKAVINVESNGHGFSTTTGKIIIQFEPVWFKRTYYQWKTGLAGHTWQSNGVRNQTLEWKAFNDAFSLNKEAAMQSTSIGMMQVMGFHYKLLGFKNAGEMWNYAKENEANQVELGIRFIKKNPKLSEALASKDWPTFAFHYNGAGYKEFNYDKRLATAYTAALNEE
jgi:hypothetical protein